MPFYSPASGYIVGKGGESLEGMRLTPGMTVLKLADHSKLWAEVEFYEDQLRHVRKGTRVLVEVDSFPGRRWAGRVVLFDSKVDPKTRTLRAYVEVDNRDLKLVPGMYATVNVAAPAVSGAVKVPSQAVLHSGERSIVIVQTGRGVFEPREVQLGAGGDGEQEVRSGLEPGEVIVTSSQFLIDSESNPESRHPATTGRAFQTGEHARGTETFGGPPPALAGTTDARKSHPMVDRQPVPGGAGDARAGCGRNLCRSQHAARRDNPTCPTSK